MHPAAEAESVIPILPSRRALLDTAGPTGAPMRERCAARSQTRGALDGIPTSPDDAGSPERHSASEPERVRVDDEGGTSPTQTAPPACGCAHEPIISILTRADNSGHDRVSCGLDA